MTILVDPFVREHFLPVRVGECPEAVRANGGAIAICPCGIFRAFVAVPAAPTLSGSAAEVTQYTFCPRAAVGTGLPAIRRTFPGAAALLAGVVSASPLHRLAPRASLLGAVFSFVGRLFSHGGAIPRARAGNRSPGAAAPPLGSVQLCARRAYSRARLSYGAAPIPDATGRPLPRKLFQISR